MNVEFLPIVKLIPVSLYSHFCIRVQSGGQAEVPDLDRHVLRQEHVAQFEISVNDPHSVHIPQAVSQLPEIVANLRLCQRFAVLHDVHQALTLSTKVNKNQNRNNLY